VVGLALFSLGAIAQTAGNHAVKDQSTNNKGHGRFAKLSFWRHHKDNQKAQAASAQRHTTGQAQLAHSKQTHAKPMQPKEAQPRAAQVKPSPAKAPNHMNQKAQPHAVGMSKVPARKGSVANRTKQQSKAQERTTASIKQ
jgi:hypothetical protein